MLFNFIFMGKVILSEGQGCIYGVGETTIQFFATEDVV